jgi:CheY-like chemotaxis protein
MAKAATIYFIDDSATMREVIKIAFRRESMNVIACHDGASALEQMEEVPPDVVISDVIMPDKDGYQVCEQIKRDTRLGKTPVILMSGVVNRAVAERSFAVQADELIRKPFEPQDLIGRVKRLLAPRTQGAPPAAAISANAALSSIFAAPPATVVPIAQPASSPAAFAGTPRAASAVATLPGPTAVVPSRAFERPFDTNSPATAPLPSMGPVATARAAAAPSPPQQPKAGLSGDQAPPAPTPLANHGNGNGGTTEPRLKLELLRMQGLVRKLQAELQAEREYVNALEAHIKTLQEAE